MIAGRFFFGTSRDRSVLPARVAQHLSDQGVLVPSVLTEDEAVKIGADATGAAPTDRSEIALCVREGLERIAKGER